MKIKIFDNFGQTFDRYTVLIDDDLYTMSYNALAPNGMNQYMGKVANFYEPEGEEEIAFSDLPKYVKKAICNRLANQY
jgi:hypothetical protein